MATEDPLSLSLQVARVQAGAVDKQLGSLSGVMEPGTDEDRAINIGKKRVQMISLISIS